MLTDSKALLFELVLPNGDTVVKECTPRRGCFFEQ